MCTAKLENGTYGVLVVEDELVLSDIRPADHLSDQRPGEFPSSAEQMALKRERGDLTLFEDAPHLCEGSHLCSGAETCCSVGEGPGK